VERDRGVAAGSSLVELDDDVAPRWSTAAVIRRVFLHQRPHVGQRDELEDVEDDQQPRRGPRPDGIELTHTRKQRHDGQSSSEQFRRTGEAKRRCRKIVMARHDTDTMTAALETEAAVLLAQLAVTAAELVDSNRDLIDAIAAALLEHAEPDGGAVDRIVEQR
jgi:hypothetical protein